MAFSDVYKTGQVVELQGDMGRLVATALVLDFDPIRSNRQASGMSKAGRAWPDHWHVAVQEPATRELLPAAIWESENPNGTFGLHIAREHVLAEVHNKPLVYSVEEFEQRIGGIAIQVSQIISIDQLD
jgi:hypothetical protein